MVTFTEEILNEKLYFLCSVVLSRFWFKLISSLWDIYFFLLNCILSNVFLQCDICMLVLFSIIFLIIKRFLIQSCQHMFLLARRVKIADNSNISDRKHTIPALSLLLLNKLMLYIYFWNASYICISYAQCYHN